MIHLLDVNVLIALIDPQHSNHDDAHGWFETRGDAGWSTCPIVENGAIRIASHPRYPGASATPALVTESLRVMRKLPGHVFWADDISLLDDGHVDAAGIKSGDVTDLYLLALAKERGGRLATFDRRIRADAVENGNDHLLHIPTA